jgi:hypothetical protein
MRFALLQEGARKRRRAKPSSMGCPSPGFFVSVADKGVTGAKPVSVASKGVVRGQLRLISAKTRSSSASVHSKDLMRRRKAAETTNAPKGSGRHGNLSRFAVCIIQEIVDFSIGGSVFVEEICGKRGKGMGRDCGGGTNVRRHPVRPRRFPKISEDS